MAARVPAPVPAACAPDTGTRKSSEPEQAPLRGRPALTRAGGPRGPAPLTVFSEVDLVVVEMEGDSRVSP